MGAPKAWITYDTFPMQQLAKPSRKLDPFMTGPAPIITPAPPTVARSASTVAAVGPASPARAPRHLSYSYPPTLLILPAVLRLP